MTRPGLEADGWVFFVLTLDRNGTHSGKRPWGDEQQAFRDLQRLSQAFFRKLRKEQKRFGWVLTGNRWVMTIESHASGWPHANVALYSPELAAELRADGLALRSGAERETKTTRARWARLSPAQEFRRRSLLKLLGKKQRVTDREVMLVRGWLREVVTTESSMGRTQWVTTPEGREERTVTAGWGRESTAEACRNSEALAGYVVKLSAEATQLGRDGRARGVGEIAKLCQAPSNARMKLRRIRAGKGFLPLRHKNDEWTGVLVRRRRAKEGDWECDPAHDPTKVKGTSEAYVEAVGVAAQNELELLLREEQEHWEARKKNRRAERPPVCRVPLRYEGRKLLDRELLASSAKDPERFAVPLAPVIFGVGDVVGTGNGPSDAHANLSPTARQASAVGCNVLFLASGKVAAD